MIFVCVGSREYQFDRLLKEMDNILERTKLPESVFAQIGQSTYLPQNFEFERFLSQDEFEKYQNEAKLIISHGGTGALVGALKKNKKVIAVPRLAKFGEHIDDHQLQVSGVLSKEKYLVTVTDMDTLENQILLMLANETTKKYNKPSYVFEIIDGFIRENI
ncbi:PssE/Cps14G family polysaccharide biosynthesis glycosyltransferase [Fundicoccus ignavus]|uniref:Glycosyl transferase n=1 Tax=Fundicoccus ignavus TaxID=2664442 RepID=A0A844BXZ9_9LACT|nr:PssE/Cps14G family polysaccharide biosynthesis glycosyltransferase [Fundicoccus ignavus]MRJ46909.1 glycosyl transferase [Fundicoccus ignavus]